MDFSCNMPCDQAEEFMKRHNMHSDSIDLDANLAVYLKEMDYGLGHGDGMLPMLPTYIAIQAGKTCGEPVVAVDIGVALAYTDALGKCAIRRIKKIAMPGIDREIGSGDFYEILAGEILPYTKKSKRISISFAHEMQATKDYDGKIVSISKEVKIKGIEGQYLGAQLKDTLLRHGAGDCKITVVNDAIAAAISVYADAGGPLYESSIGLIVGTGTNTGYFEQNANIRKVPGLPEGGMFVNVESGNYTGQPRGAIDEAFDETTMNPGKCTMEKMISGRYIGELFYHVVKTAVGEGLFSEGFRRAFPGMPVLSTSDMDDFLKGKRQDRTYSGLRIGEHDRKMLQALAGILIVRAAKLIALEIAGAAVKSGKGRHAGKPVPVVAEGTTIVRLPGLKENVQRFLDEWLRQTVGIHARLYEVEDCILKGAAAIGFDH